MTVKLHLNVWMQILSTLMVKVKIQMGVCSIFKEPCVLIGVFHVQPTAVAESLLVLFALNKLNLWTNLPKQTISQPVLGYKNTIFYKTVMS